MVDDDAAFVEAQEVPQGKGFGKRFLVAPRDVVEDGIAHAGRPVGRGALVGAVRLCCAPNQEVDADVPGVDIEARLQSGLVHGGRVRRVDEDDTRSRRCDRRQSTRWNGFRGCPNTCSSSSNHESTAPHSTVT